MADAFYFHATLYRFGVDARKEVIAKFNATVQDVSVRCWYDTEQDMFCLACPQNIGANADEVLGQHVSEFVNRGVSAGETKEYLPKIHRFPESIIDDFEIVQAKQNFDGSLTEQTSPSSSCVAKGAAPLCIHYVSAGPASIASLKLFKLRDLPEGMLERTLATPEGVSARAVHVGLTCRTARWDISKHDYVFNGRIGASLPTDSTANFEGNIIQCTEYVSLHGIHPHDNYVDNDDKNVQLRSWTFKGDTPSAQQWLEGMGDMVPAEPPQISEVPADAKKFLARPNEQVLALGRTRIPKGSTGTLDSSDDDDVTKEEEANTKAKSANFMKLMKANGRSDDGRSSDKEDSGSENSTNSSNKGKPNLYSLFKKKEAVHQQSRLPVLNTSPNTQVAGGTPKQEVQALSGKTGQSSLEGDPSSSAYDEAFPTYNRRYVNVDKVGLTSIATNHAQWEHENLSPSRKKSSRLGITRRQPSQLTQPLSPLPTSGSSAPMSLSTGPELLRRSRLPTPSSLTSAGPGSPTIRNCAEIDTIEQQWAKRIVRVTPPSGKLIDDTTPVSPESVKMPPGSKRQNRSGLVGSTQWTAQNTTNEAGTNVNSSQTLIDISDTEPISVKPRVMLPPMLKPLQPSNVGAGTSSNNRIHSEDEIVERLQPETNDQDLKRNTMRQKAKKKGKGHNASSKKSKGAKPKAELPKPDPVPPPKTKAAKSAEQTASDSPHTGAKLKQKKSAGAKRSSTETPDSDDMNNAIPAESATGMGELLQKILQGDHVTGANVEARFGIILVRYTSINKEENKDFRKGVYTPQTLQAKIRGAAGNLSTDFFSRLTTSDADALYILGLVQVQTVQTAVTYEIHIKNSDGQFRLIKFDQKSTEDLVVLKSDTMLGTMYLHYPIHVWDVQAVVERPEMDELMMATAGAFVLTMQTFDEAPSFRAMVPSDSFTVERVYAKRIFTKLSDDIELRVTEVQDLLLESINGPRHNFKAAVLPKELMIDQHRLWWECSLHTQSVEPDTAEKLQVLVDGMILKMDGVGFGNKGPWVRSEIEEIEGSVMLVPDTPFW